MLSLKKDHRVKGWYGLVVCALLALCSVSFSDEYTVTEESDPIKTGDFNLSSSNEAFNMTLPIGLNNGTITAGELWSFYNEAGVKKLDKITICLDVDPIDGGKRDLQFSTIDLTIVDSLDPSKTLKKYTLDKDGDHSVRLPVHLASSYRPEAKFDLSLGFDFMEEFSASSQQKVVLNVKMADGSTTMMEPRFYFTGQRNSFNFVLVALFAIFWACVFFVLFKVTNPTNRQRVTKKPVVTV